MRDSYIHHGRKGWCTLIKFYYVQITRISNDISIWVCIITRVHVHVHTSLVVSSSVFHMSIATVRPSKHLKCFRHFFFLFDGCDVSTRFKLLTCMQQLPVGIHKAEWHALIEWHVLLHLYVHVVLRICTFVSLMLFENGQDFIQTDQFQ